jgi:hypothetical protein
MSENGADQQKISQLRDNLKMAIEILSQLPIAVAVL